VFAPSGSGKTRSIAIPNLFHFPYSVVCNDVKFTLFETTSGFRHTVLGHECYCFAPTRKNGITHRFNPLASISQNKLERITDIQQIAHIFMPDNPKEQAIWTQASRKLFKTLMLYLLDSQNHPTTLGEINRLVKQEHFDTWLQELLDKTDHFDPEFYRNGYSYLNNHEKTRQGIIETFSSYFELFDDPFVDAATSGSDFDFADLRRKKMTIYIGFTDEDMERLAPLLTLFWQQLISRMIKEIPDPKHEPYPLLCLIDEFSSLGRIERLRRSLKLLREYRVRCILMFQYIAQTYEKYSHDEAKAFINIKTKIAYTTEDINDAELISKMLGTRTKKVVNSSITNQQQGLSDGKSISYQAIPLMRPDEIMKMPSNVSLIMRSGFSPIKAKQWIWYKEPFMKNRVMPSVFVPTQTAKQMPFIRKKNTNEASCLQSVECID
jgi:type IV secretion system protein VirD4